MKTVLILGGGGFLAGYAQRHYARLGWRTISIGRGATTSRGQLGHAWNLPHSEFAHMLAVEQPEICINAAGRASVPASMVEPLADFEASTLLTYRILDDLRRRSPQTIYLHLSSASVYGNPASLPVREDANIAPISPYGWHKRLSEIVVEEHARQFGLRTASLRIFSAYGPTLRRQVVWDIITRARANPNRTLVLQGAPEDTRDFIHGADVASAMQVISERGALEGECYNVASGTETSIRALGELVLRVLNHSSDIAFDFKPHPGKPNRWCSDISKLRALSFAVTRNLEDGIREVAAEIAKMHG